jgi:hypothetical protein
MAAQGTSLRLEVGQESTFPTTRGLRAPFYWLDPYRLNFPDFPDAFKFPGTGKREIDWGFYNLARPNYKTGATQSQSGFARLNPR